MGVCILCHTKIDGCLYSLSSLEGGSTLTYVGTPIATGAVTAGAAPGNETAWDYTINFMAGFSDVATLWVAPTVRWVIGYDPGIDRSSVWYWAGAATPVVIATGGAATLPSGIGAAGATTTAIGTPPVFVGTASAAPALGAGARQVLLRYGTRASAMTALAQMQAIRDAIPRGTDAYITLTSRLDQFEAAIIEAFGR